MRAVQRREYGKTEVLSVDIPTPGKGQVLVRVERPG